MGLLFWKKQVKANLNSEEYEQLAKKVLSISTSQDILEAKLHFLEGQYRSLRSKYNRTPQETEDMEKTKNSDAFDDIRELQKKFK